ncbi:MAG: recombinase family protein, partial [Solirubrobacteraceae bacterium]
MTATAIQLPTPRPRAIGILRISEVGEREDEDRLHSDESQIAGIERDCQTRGFELIDLISEKNISGGAPLDKRPFGKAIERVERGEAEAIVFAWRDRTDRSIVYGSEAIERMDAVGAVLLAGGSTLTHATADKWAEATMGSFMGEWQRRVIKEKSADGVARAVAMGRVPFPTLPIGLLRNEDGTARLDEPRVQEIVREAFRRRARGDTIASVRAYLAEQGFERSYRSVQIMFKSRLYRGQIVHGDHVNLSPGFGAIIDRDLWDAVQRVSVPSGRTAKSDRLLARLGVLRCASCGSRMVAGAQVSRWGDTTRRYTFYKCGHGHECPRPAVITAEPLEALVIERVKMILSDAEERESAAREARDAADEAQDAQAALDAAQERFLLLPPGANHEKALALVQELTRDRDDKRARAERLMSARGLAVVSAADVLDDPRPEALSAKRGLIRATLAAVT